MKVDGEQRPSADLPCPPSPSVCPECRHLKMAILKQLDAFKVLTSLNSGLSFDIIIQNIRGLITNHDELHGPNVTRPAHPIMSTAMAPMVQQIVQPEIKFSGGPLHEELDTMEEPALQPSPTMSAPTVPKKRKICRRGKEKTWTQRCTDLCHTMLARADATPFKKKYVDVHSDPLDRSMYLEKIEENLQSGTYSDPKEFHKDMMVIFHNARLHHIDLNSSIRIKARSLEKFYETSVETQNLLGSSADEQDSQSQPDPDIDGPSGATSFRRHLRSRNRSLIRCPKCCLSVRKNLQFNHQKSCGGVERVPRKLKIIQKTKMTSIKIKQKPHQKLTKTAIRSIQDDTDSRRRSLRNKDKGGSKNNEKDQSLISNKETSTVMSKTSSGIRGNQHELVHIPDLDVHLFVKNLYPKFDLAHALSAKVHIERLHPRTLLTARKRIKNSVPGYKPSKWGRNCTSKQRRKAMLKLDRISGLYNSRNFVTKPKTVFNTKLSKKKKGGVRTVASTNSYHSSKRFGTSNGEMVQKIRKPVAVTLTFAPSNFVKQEAPEQPMETEEVYTDFANAANICATIETHHDENSMLVISSAEAAAFGLHPFEGEEVEAADGQFGYYESAEIFDPSSEMMVGHIVIGSHDDDDDELGLSMTVSSAELVQVHESGGCDEHQSQENEETKQLQENDDDFDSKIQNSSITPFDTIVLQILRPPTGTEEVVQKICSHDSDVSQDIEVSMDKDQTINGDGGNNSEFSHENQQILQDRSECEWRMATNEDQDINLVAPDAEHQSAASINEKMESKTDDRSSPAAIEDEPRKTNDQKKSGTNEKKMSVQGHPKEFNGGEGVVDKKAGLKATIKALAQRLVQAERRRCERVKCLDCPMDFEEVGQLWEHQSVCQAALDRVKAMEERALRLEEERVEEEKIALENA